MAITGAYKNSTSSADAGYCVNCHNLGELGVRCEDCWKTVPLKLNSAGVELINWYQKKYHCVFVKAGFHQSELRMKEMPCWGVLTQPARGKFFLSREFFYELVDNECFFLFSFPLCFFLFGLKSVMVGGKQIEFELL